MVIKAIKNLIKKTTYQDEGDIVVEEPGWIGFGDGTTKGRIPRCGGESEYKLDINKFNDKQKEEIENYTEMEIDQLDIYAGLGKLLYCKKGKVPIKRVSKNFLEKLDELSDKNSYNSEMVGLLVENKIFEERHYLTALPTPDLEAMRKALEKEGE